MNIVVYLSSNLKKQCYSRKDSRVSSAPASRTDCGENCGLHTQIVWSRISELTGIDSRMINPLNSY